MARTLDRVQQIVESAPEGEPAYLPWWVWTGLTIVGIGAWIGLGYIVGAILFAVWS